MLTILYILNLNLAAWSTVFLKFNFWHHRELVGSSHYFAGRVENLAGRVIENGPVYISAAAYHHQFCFRQQYKR